MYSKNGPATSAVALNSGIADQVADPEPTRRGSEPAQDQESPERPRPEQLPEPAALYGVGHNRGPSLLQADDVLDGGVQIHTYVCQLLGRKQSLASTYYQIAKGRIPAHRFGSRLIGSRRGIATALAAGTGLVTA